MRRRGKSDPFAAGGHYRSARAIIACCCPWLREDLIFKSEYLDHIKLKIDKKRYLVISLDRFFMIKSQIFNKYNEPPLTLVRCNIDFIEA